MERRCGAKVAHLTCNERVTGSSPVTGSSFIIREHSILCVSKTSIIGAIGESEFQKQVYWWAQELYDTHKISISIPNIEGEAYDCVIHIDGRPYRAQVKTTLKRNNKITFGTSHNGRPYTSDEVDLLLLYYYDKRKHEEWWGLVLPSECSTSFTTEYEDNEYNFDIRFPKMIKEKKIEPVYTKAGYVSKNTGIISELIPVWPDDPEAIDEIVSYYEWDWQTIQSVYNFSDEELEYYKNNYVAQRLIIHMPVKENF